MFKYSSVVLGCLLLAFTLSEGAKFPANQRKCKYSDSKCFIEVATEVLKRGPKGYPEMGLPVFEPLRISKLEINQPDGPVTIKLSFKNLDLHGLSKARITKASGFEKNFVKAKIEVGVDFPAMRLEGPYKIDGRVQVLPVQGQGPANMTFGDLKTTMKFIAKKVERNGKEYLHIEKSKLDFEPSTVKVRFENLFNGNKELGETVNNFFNENWRDIMKELKPAIQKSILEIYNVMLNNVFMNIPYAEMFDD